MTVDRDARCEVCGHDAFVHDDVIWPELAREWELSVAERAQIKTAWKYEPGENLRLDCKNGYGTATFVTGAFGFAAAAVVVKLITAATHE